MNNSRGVQKEILKMKLIFSNIKCKINLNDYSLFSLVIRIGKASSKYTTKKQLKNNLLDFSESLEVPVDEKLLMNQSSKKQKCEVMLYKFKINRQKQGKQLIGMASISINNQMLQQQIKKIRLTNSFDKQAYVQFNLKAQLGQADVQDQQFSRTSSFFIKSEGISFNDLEQIKYDDSNKNSLHRSDARIDQERNSPLSHKQNNFIQLINDLQAQDDFHRSGSQKMRRSPRIINFNNSKKGLSGIGPLSIRQQLNQQPIKSNSETQLQQKNSLLQICTKLQNQNQFLMSKLQNLQNHVYQKQKSQGESLQQSLAKSNKSTQSAKRSPMIKKNLKLVISSPTKRLHSNESISTDLTPSQPDKIRTTQKKDCMNINQIMYSSKGKPLHLIGMQSIKQSESQYSPITVGKSNRLSQLQNSLEFNKEGVEGSQLLSQLGYTFAGETGEKPMSSFRLPSLNLKSNTIRITIQPKKLTSSQFNSIKELSRYQKDNILSSGDSFIDSNNQSVINRSISGIQKTHIRSYSRFNSKYKIVGSVKPSVSLTKTNSQYKNQQKEVQNNLSNALAVNKQENVQIRISSLSNLSDVGNQQSGFLNEEKIQVPFNYIQRIKSDQFSIGGFGSSLTRKQNKQNSKKECRTLQQLDNDTQFKYRKNQRKNRQAIKQLTLTRNKAIRQNQQLKKQLQKKKNLTYQQFQFMHTQINHLQQYYRFSEQKLAQNYHTIQQITKKYNQLNEENNLLKKKFNEINNKAIEYKKIIQINDYQYKEVEIDENSNNSNTANNLNTNNNIEKASGSVVLVNKNNMRSKSSIEFLDLPEQGSKKFDGKSQKVKKITSIKSVQKNQQTLTPRHPQIKTTHSQRVPSQYDAQQSFIKAQNSQLKSKGVQVLKNHARPIIPKPQSVIQHKSLTNSSHTTNMLNSGNLTIGNVTNQGIKQGFTNFINLMANQQSSTPNNGFNNNSTPSQGFNLGGLFSNFANNTNNIQSSYPPLPSSIKKPKKQQQVPFTQNPIISFLTRMK